MKQRVEKLKGEIKFGSSDQKGFNIHVKLPMENSNKEA
jgi:signal transduction histidine kinase